jgi:hypothetical protein
LREKGQGPFKTGGKLSAYGKNRSRSKLNDDGVEMSGGASSDLPAGWVSDIDEASGYPFYTNTTTGIVQWEKPAHMSMKNPMNKASHGRNETQLPAGWGKDFDGEGNKYYYGNNGEVSWEAPPGSVGGSAGGGSGGSGLLPSAASHGRSETELPANWGKDVDGEGNHYYYGNNGEVSWTAPPGSTKDGVVHPDLQ